MITHQETAWFPYEEGWPPNPVFRAAIGVYNDTATQTAKEAERLRFERWAVEQRRMDEITRAAQLERATRAATVAMQLVRSRRPATKPPEKPKPAILPESKLGRRRIKFEN